MAQKYLITLQSSADVDEFLTSAKEAGCTSSNSAPPIPMKGGESVVTVVGPPEAFDQLKDLSSVVKVSRSSEMHLY